MSTCGSFRGHLAPASLKVSLAPTLRMNRRSRFRGHLAPASLKDQHAAGDGGFRAAVSGAILPRPH